MSAAKPWGKVYSHCLRPSTERRKAWEMSSLPELSVSSRPASRPADSPCITVDHSAAGEWCWGRSTKSPTSWLRWGSRSADFQCIGLIVLSSLVALCVQYRTLRDDILWFCGVIGNATKFYVRQRYQTELVLGGRPILRCLILCMNVDARCLLTTVCPAQKPTKTLNLAVVQVCPVLNPQKRNHLLAWELNCSF